MKTDNSNLKRALVKIIATLQIVTGALLLVGTVGLTLTAYRTVQDESNQLTDNLTATADALESLRMTYEQSATNLFGLTDTIDDISTKLGDVSQKISRTGELFTIFMLKDAGEKWKDVGKDVASISETLKRQGEVIADYRDDGHEKALLAISKTVESLYHAIRILDGGCSAGQWCGYICLLGFCVSMLFFSNGALLLVVNKHSYKDAQKVLNEETKTIQSNKYARTE